MTAQVVAIARPYGDARGSRRSSNSPGAVPPTPVTIDLSSLAGKGKDYAKCEVEKAI